MKGDCSGLICCRKESGKAENPTESAKKWGHIGKCDIPVVSLLVYKFKK